MVDSKQHNLGNILTQKHFDKLGQRVRRHTAQDFIRHVRTQIIGMIEQAEQLAGQQEQTIIDVANRQMQELQQAELDRLRALAEVNPNIRQQEIDHLLAETDALKQHLHAASLKLEALRVAVVTD